MPKWITMHDYILSVPSLASSNLAEVIDSNGIPLYIMFRVFLGIWTCT